MDGDFSQQVTNLVCDSFIRGVQGNPDASLHEIAQLVAQLGLYTTPLGVLLDNAIEARGEAPPPRLGKAEAKKPAFQTNLKSQHGRDELDDAVWIWMSEKKEEFVTKDVMEAFCLKRSSAKACLQRLVQGGYIKNIASTLKPKWVAC